MLDIFEILGPIMVGPSSSHTAGAVRIGRMARTLLGEPPVKADIGLYGSFAETGRGHGTDRALVAGLLGMKPDDLRIPESFSVAKEQGLSFVFHPAELREAHPNTAVLTVEGASGKKTKVQAASIGGGRIRVDQLDGVAVDFTGIFNTLIVRHMDVPGELATLTKVLSDGGINIANMSLVRDRRGGSVMTIFEIDQPVPAAELEQLKARSAQIETDTQSARARIQELEGSAAALKSEAEGKVRGQTDLQDRSARITRELSELTASLAALEAEQTTALVPTAQAEEPEEDSLVLKFRKPYKFEGVEYSITIEEVAVFPQGYAALMTEVGLLQDEPSMLLMDLGGWTVDLMRIDNAIPVADTAHSLELGMIRCVDDIREQVRRETGLSLTDAQIENMLAGQPCTVSDTVRDIVNRQGRKYTEHLLSATMEAGFDLHAIPAVLLGGGASVVSRHLSPKDGLCKTIFLLDDKVNAVGFERALAAVSRRKSEV